MKSVSKLISPSNKVNLLSTWKNNNSIKNDSIKEEIENEKEKENEKEIILNNNLNSLNNTKKSLNFNNDNLFITFGEMPKENITINNQENNINENQPKKDILSTLTKENNLNNLLNSTKKNYEEEDENLDTEGICNFYKETKKLKSEDISNKVNEALKDAKDSEEEQDNFEEINNKINFFEDTIGKIKKKKNNDIINLNDRQQLDLIISGEIEDLDTFKRGEMAKKLNLNSYKKNYDSNNSEDDL
jgi:RecG-like helicase